MQAMVTWEFDNITYTEVVELVDEDTYLLTPNVFGILVEVSADQVYKQYPKLVFFVGNEGRVFGLQAEKIKSIKRIEE